MSEPSEPSLSDAAAAVADALGRTYTAEDAETVPQDRWPQQPPVEGHIYGFMCPATGVPMAAMTAETFRKIDSTVADMRAKILQLRFDLDQVKQNGGKSGLIIEGKGFAGRKL